jgi:aryl-alcohol dehydrogenase-like predicted oxidoreductase
MKSRKLGSAGLEVSAIGYGAMGAHIGYGASDVEGAAKTVHRAYELGITLFDTAEMYGWGENEKFLGKAVHGFRDDIKIATKFGFVQDPTGGWNMELNSTPENIRKVAEASLLRLGVDHIDLFYQHRPDPNVPIEDVAGTVGDLIQEGKVGYFGMSEVGENLLRRANAVQQVSALQTEYSIFERDAEVLIPVLAELGIGFVPYSPLGRGFLTGQTKPAAEYDQTDIRSMDPRWQPGNYEKNLDAVQKLSALAQAKGGTVAQLALAWLLAQGENIVPIPGTRNANRVAENAGAAEFDLNAEDLAAISEILPKGGFGARYIKEFMPEWD